MKCLFKYVFFYLALMMVIAKSEAQTNNAIAPPPVPNLSAIEYYIDIDPGLGNATNVSIGAATSATDVLVNIDPATLTSGVHTFGIRSKDANGAWSIDNKWIFFKPYGVGTNINPPPPIPNLTKVEYYIDNDPGLGAATNYTVTSAQSLNDLLINIDPATLTSGVHTFGIRSQDANGAWSLDNKWIFFKPYGSGTNINPPPPIPNLTKVEYYIDTDPGLGAATNYPVTAAQTLNDLLINIDPATLTSGVHTFGIRSKDANGAWSLDNKWIFFKPYGVGTNINPPPALPNITKIEYYIDTDPGFGNATNYAVTPSTNLADLTVDLDPATLTAGVHTFGIRSKDANGAWSLDNKWIFFKPFGAGGNINPPPPVPNIVQVEYYIDTDPGLGLAIQIPITANTDLNNLTIDASITGLPIGNHKIGVRAKDANGAWSFVNKWDFVVPSLTVAPNAINYGLKAINSSTTNNVVLTNNGLPGQTITSVTLNAPFSTSYTPGAIPTNGTVTIPVTFNPTALLAYQDTLYINTTSGIFKVGLSGSAAPQNPQWASNTLNYNFGNRIVGSNTNVNFTITNTGNIPLTVGSFTSTNPVFAVTMSNTNIPVGGTVNAQVTYSPNAIASFSGIIKLVNTSNTNDTIFIQVNGTGYVPSIAPILTFPNSVPYNGTVGVNPAVGNTGTYTYSVKYSSATNVAPALGYPKVGIDFNADGDFIDPGEGLYSMSKAGVTSNWSIGENFEFSTNLNLGSNYRYKFFANDSLGNISTSLNIGLNVGPLVTTQTLDLSIYANDITFSVQNPSVGQTFIVSAVVHNNSPYSASNVPIRFYQDSIYLTSGTIPFIAANSTATITQPLSFSPDGFYPIKVWIDSSNTLGEVQVLNNYASRPIIVGNFSIPGEILITSNATTYTCYNRVYISGTAVYSGLNLVGNPPVLGATVTVNVPGVGVITTNTITGGFWSVYYNPNNIINFFNCATNYNYSVTVTDYTLTKTINPPAFNFPCVTCTTVIPVPYFYITYNNTCPLDNLSFTETFSMVNALAPSYKDTVRVYADNVIKYQYSRDSIGLGQSVTYNSVFTLPQGLRNLKYVHKYTNTLNGVLFDSSTYNINVYVQPNLPDFSWFTTQFQTGPRSFGISLQNYPCVNAGSNKVFLYDSMPGNLNYLLIDSFAIPPIAALSGFPINYTRPSWIAGYHYLKLVADVYTQVVERDETNNIYLGLVYVPFPELSGVINGVSNPAMAGGSIVNFTATIYNNGADAQNFKVQFLVDGIPLGNKISIAPMLGNSTLNIVSPLYTSAADSCPHTIRLVVDVDNEVTELNETNNTNDYILGIDIKWPNEVCCLVGIHTPFQFQKDVAGNFFGYAYNKGTRHAANVKMRFTYNGSVIANDVIPVLQAGQILPSGNINYTFNSPGLKTIRIDYDYNNELCEINETNNVGYVYVYVNQDLPNLQILSQHIAPSLLNPDPGQTVTVVASVFNKGSGSAAPTKLRFYYNDGPGYVQLGNDIPINMILPGRDTTVAATATFSPGSVGLKIIKVKVDALDEIVETSEVDNEATRSIVAGAAPDFARSLSQGITINPISFAAGDSVTIRNYIRNYGGATGTAWMRIYVKDEFHNIIKVDSVLFTINGVDSALVFKKMKVNMGRGYFVTEIVRSTPPEFNELNNTDSLFFTSVYALPIAVVLPTNLDLTQAYPASFPTWIGGSLILGNNSLNVNGIVNNADSTHLIVTTGIGKLKLINNNASNLFPVATALGKPGFITINNLGTTDNFAVSVADSVKVNGITGATILTEYVNKTWDIVEQTPGGSNATLTVTWSASDELPGFNRANCGITHFENGAWKGFGAGPATVNANGTFTKTVTGFNSFSPFSITSRTSVLPIKWLSVNAIFNNNNDALVTWKVEESFIKNYEVEKSLDGINFLPIAVKNSIGNGTNNYFVVDKLSNNERTVYYRIKQNSLDGQESYSSIVKVANNKTLLFTIYPNPTIQKSILRVNDRLLIGQTYTVVNADGKTIYNGTINGLENEIDLGNNAAGIYLIKISGQYSGFLIKQ
jgi:CARDB